MTVLAWWWAEFVGGVGYSGYVSSNGEAALVARLRADLYELVAVDVVSLPDATLRSELVELLAAANQLNAAIAARVASVRHAGVGRW